MADLSEELGFAKKSQSTNKLAQELFGVPPKPEEDLPFSERLMRGLRDPFAGGAQLLEKGVNAISPSAVQSINQANNWLADKTGLVQRLPEGGVNQLEQDLEKKYQSRRGADAGFDAARLLGNVVSPANFAIASRIPMGAAGLGSRVGLGAATGAASSAINPVYGDNPDDYWKEKLKQIAIGAGAGGALPILGKGISSIVSPAASKNADLQLLMQEGVKPSIGQTLGGALNRVEEKLQSVPIMGDMITKARQNATSGFETAVFNRALKPIGLNLPEGVSGREAIVFTENALRDKYDDVLAKIGAISPDNTFNQNVSKVSTMVNKMLIPTAEKEKFNQAIGNIAASIDKNKMMTSESYKILESELGSDAKKLGMSQNIYESKLSPAIKQLQIELKDMLKRQAGQHSDELQASNTGWASFKRVQDAASKLGADNGNFTPAQYQNSVRSMGGKSSFARGGALNQDLGDAGKSILTNKVPNSGTADRAMLGLGALFGGGAINPAIPAGLVGGAAMYTPQMQNLLRMLATSRPQGAGQLANSIEQMSPAAVPFFSGLLNQYGQ